MSHGTFSGEPVATWLTEPGPDRNMELKERFTFTDPDGKVWEAPAGSTIDGASIPRALWAIVGSPYTGDYRRASILHDVACRNAAGDKAARRAADRMIYHGCIAGGCSVEEATIIYLGVRIGALASSVPQWTPAIAAAHSGPRLAATATENKLQDDFGRAADIVLDRGVVDNIDEIEKRTDKALAVVAHQGPAPTVRRQPHARSSHGNK
jgi:hypothetical protein